MPTSLQSLLLDFLIFASAYYHLFKMISKWLMTLVVRLIMQNVIFVAGTSIRMEVAIISSAITIREHFIASMGIILGTFFKMCGLLMNHLEDESKWKNIFVQIIRAFWILVSIQNNAYLIASRNALGTMVNVLAANQDISGTQLMRDLIFILRHLAAPIFSFMTHIMLYITIDSTIKSFWTALKPINRLLKFHDLSCIRTRSILAATWIATVVYYTTIMKLFLLLLDLTV